MGKKRIFLATPFENRMAKRGTRFPALADFLIERGYHVEYITTDFSHAYKRHFSAEEISAHNKTVQYDFTILPIPAYNHNISARRIYCNSIMALRHFCYLRKRLQRGDVIIVPSRPIELILSVAIAAKIIGAKVVLDISDIWPDALVISDRLKKAVFSIYCNIYLHISLRMINTCVHSAPCFQDWLNRYNNSAKSIFIPLGYDSKRWESVKPRRGLVGKRLSLVFVGLFQLQLDVMPVLKALLDRPKVQFVLIGDNGTGQRYPEVTAFIARHNMKNVNMIGRLEPEQVVAELKHHDIAVIPMISSSIPNKVFDAIAAYLPMIVLGENDSADFVNSQGIGWSVPFDEKRVGDLLDRITEDAIIEKQYNIRRVRSRWSRDVLFQDFIGVISSCWNDNQDTVSAT